MNRCWQGLSHFRLYLYTGDPRGGDAIVPPVVAVICLLTLLLFFLVHLVEFIGVVLFFKRHDGCTVIALQDIRAE